MKQICVNRKAKFEYTILDKYNAGLVLQGGEVKSVRNQYCNINQAYIAFKNGVPVIYGMNIDAYKQSMPSIKYEPKRIRSLLLHKREINKLVGKMQQSNFTLIPLQIFISDTGYVKVEFGLCQGKKLHDKRESIKEREVLRSQMSFNRGVYE